MRLIEYKCEQCEKTVEQLFNSDESIPDELKCPSCEGQLKKTLNLKSNCHRERIQDRAIGTANPLRGIGSRRKYNG